MEFTAEPGSGEIEITLKGKAMVLKPSLEACLAISKMGGGLNAAIVRCRNLDFDTIAEVVRLGLGYGANTGAAKEIPLALYEQGVIDIAGACIDFVHVVANGGRLPTDEVDKPPDPPNEPSQ